MPFGLFCRQQLKLGKAIHQPSSDHRTVDINTCPNLWKSLLLYPSVDESLVLSVLLPEERCYHPYNKSETCIIIELTKFVC